MMIVAPEHRERLPAGAYKRVAKVVEHDVPRQPLEGINVTIAAKPTVIEQRYFCTHDPENEKCEPGCRVLDAREDQGYVRTLSKEIRHDAWIKEPLLAAGRKSDVTQDYFGMTAKLKIP